MIIGFLLLGSVIGIFVAIVSWAFAGVGIMAALGLYLACGVGGAGLGALLSVLRGVAMPSLRPVRLPASV